MPEWHKTDHGLHVHFAVGRYIPRHKIDAAWGHGFIHIKSLSDLPVGSTGWDEARRAAGYLSKYVTKSFQRDRGTLKRYAVGHGFQPQVRRLHGRSADDVLDQACALMGGEPAHVWSSRDAEDWQGPPAVWAKWSS